MAAWLKTRSVMCLRRGTVYEAGKGGSLVAYSQEGASPGLTLEPWLPEGGRGRAAINSLQGLLTASSVNTKVILQNIYDCFLKHQA